MAATTLFDYPLEMYSLPSTVRTDKKGESTEFRGGRFYCGIFNT